MSAAKNGRTILLGEDDLEVRNYLETVLRCEGYEVSLAQDGEEVLACLRANQPGFAAVVLDIIMSRLDGIETLTQIRRMDREMPVIMISGDASATSAVRAMKHGASDFLAKPIQPEALRKALRAVVDLPAPCVAPASEPLPAPVNKHVMFGVSPRMRELQGRLPQIAWSEAPVLIQGETGTGKEVLARELHASSRRAKKAFLKLNCAALPSELVESELFGYERGAFTGAYEKKPGMFAMADGGTILLDEIGDMDFKLQAKLLQVLQDHEFQRLGGKETIKVDVRVIAATHRNLEKAIAEDRFREDLYYRLNVISIMVPALRERREDIIPLSEFLIRKHSEEGFPAAPLPPLMKEVFLLYHWPGNVRELENIIRKFLVFQEARPIEQELRLKLQPSPQQVAAAPVVIQEPPTPINLTVISSSGNSTEVSPDGPPVLEMVASAKRDAERTAILNALKMTNWNRKRAALLLQIDYKALLYKMKKLSIRKEKPLSQVRHEAAAQVAHAAGDVVVAFRRG